MPVITASYDRVAEVIREGGVALCPTEGVYGLSCDIHNDVAVRKIIAIKRRSDAKGLITVADSFDRVADLVDASSLSEKTKTLLHRLWPGPFTFIMPVACDFSRSLMGAHRSLAVRVTDFEPMRSICALAQTAVVSTSANISGQSAVNSFADLNEEILTLVDIALNLPCGGLKAPTTIYDTITGSLIRKGPGWEDFTL